MLLYLFYHLLWTFAVIVFFPVWALFFRKTKITRRLFHIVPVYTRGNPTPHDTKHMCIHQENRTHAFSMPEKHYSESIWVHALSVGEVISAVPLIKALAEEFPHKSITVTVTTDKGMDIAKKELEGSSVSLFVMPLDFWWSVLHFINTVRPCVFVLVETDIWPGMIYILRKRAVRTVLVNGRISPRTFVAYRKYRCIVRKIFDSIALCLMQSSLDTQRLLELGISKEKVFTVGNIKFDRDWLPMTEEEESRWRKEICLPEKQRLWIAGSTHKGEEQILLEVQRRLLVSHPDLRMIIAPRQIRDADRIRSIAREKGLRTASRTGLGCDHDYDVLILDTVGELGRIYGLGCVSFVGGSLVPFGGHNLLEPASFGCPVLFGPHTHNFVEMSEGMIKSGGGLCVRDTEELFYAVKSLIEDTVLREDMGEKARDFVYANRGTLKRIVLQIRQAISSDLPTNSVHYHGA